MRGEARGAAGLLLLIAAASVCGCSEDKSISAPTAVNAELVSFDLIRFSWSPPSKADALEAQARIESGAWQWLGAGPGGASSVLVTLGPTAPEAATYAFRVRAWRGEAVSEWSEIATVFRGLRPAANLEALTPNLGMPVLLTWTRGSTVAQAIRLERRVVEFDGLAGAWSELAALAPDATSFTDGDIASWVDGASLEYRLVYVKDAIESAPAVARSTQAPPLAPAGLSGAPADVTSIRLDWTPRSRYATKQVVIRQARWAPGSSEVAELANDAATYVDAVPAPGQYVYRISARVGDWTNVTNYVADGDPALGFTARPDLPFAMSAKALPGGEQAARDSQGLFATAASHAIQAWRETPDGWVTHMTVEASPTLSDRGILFGPGDRLHLLYGLFPAAGLRHEWLDGAWQAETVSEGTAQDAVADGAGALHVVACGFYADYATNAGGTWTTVRLPASGYPDRCAIAVGPAGDVRVAYTSPRPVAPGESSPTASDLHLLTGSGSTWTEELVPLGADGAKLYGTVLHLFAPDADRTVLLYEGPSGTSDVSVRSIARDGAGWGPPVDVGLRRFSVHQSFAAAMSPDGSRVAIAWNGVTYMGSGSPATLAIRDAAGSWASWPLLETELGVALGFSPSGKVWVLDGLGGGPLGGVLYEEL